MGWFNQSHYNPRTGTWVKPKKYRSNYSSGRRRKNDGCYVATAVYGSYDCPEVWTLRRYRDYHLGNSFFGRMFIRIYYAISPIIVKFFGNTVWFNKLFKKILDKFVENLSIQGYSSEKYEDIGW